jgi:hypothetical protein
MLLIIRLVVGKVVEEGLVDIIVREEERKDLVELVAMSRVIY